MKPFPQHSISKQKKFINKTAKIGQSARNYRIRNIQGEQFMTEAYETFVNIDI